jgi:hypothetical protein
MLSIRGYDAGDEVARVSQEEASRTIVPQFVRQVAVVGAVAFVMGRAVAPALRGAREGLDTVIAYTDLVGSFTSYLFAFGGMSAVILELMLTSREKRLGAFYRVAALVVGVCVISLVAPAFREPLPERANIVAAVTSGVLALMASREAIAVPRTRALGVLLVAAGAAALLRLSASLVAWHAGERALYGLAVFARVIATSSVFFDTLTLLIAFAWLATRPQKTTVWAARFALFAGCLLAAGAARGGGRESSPLWELVTYRAVDRLLPLPAAYVWLPYRFVLETCAPLLAFAAVTARGQMPAIAASMALVLLARPSTDVPLSALALTLAALSTPLAARDDRGMWAVLMAHSHPPEPLGEPAEPRPD